jgi:hypothetical protein
MEAKNCDHATRLRLRNWFFSSLLERWRFLKTGPYYLKIGGRVVYRVEDVEAYEDEVIRRTTFETTPPANTIIRPFR